MIVIAVIAIAVFALILLDLFTHRHTDAAMRGEINAPQPPARDLPQRATARTAQ
jgi:hypothetical protein